MTDKEQFDFWYAVHNTDVVRLPEKRLETFGTTVLNYHLVSELMDAVDRVRVREGRIEAARPEIVTPQSFLETPLDGFGSEAAEYVEWLREHAKDLYILKYGFTIRKRETNEYLISDTLEAVTERVRKALEEKDDPMSALAIGVDQPWEVCLLKLMVDIAEGSVRSNVHDLKRKGLFERARNDPTGAHREVEQAFRAAAKDRSQIDRLASLLRAHGLFKEYEDRFFALVRSKS